MIVSVGQDKREFVFATAWGKNTQNVEESDPLTEELDRLSSEFIKREKIPKSVTRAGYICIKK